MSIEKVKTSVILTAALVVSYFGARATLVPSTSGWPADAHPFGIPAAIAATLPPWAVPIAPAAYLFALTLAGIMAQTLWSPPQGRKMTRSDWWKAAMRPVLISPIVLYATLAMAQKQPDALVAGLMAFQNGFFWRTILHRGEAKTSPAR